MFAYPRAVLVVPGHFFFCVFVAALAFLVLWGANFRVNCRCPFVRLAGCEFPSFFSLPVLPFSCGVRSPLLIVAAPSMPLLSSSCGLAKGLYTAVACLAFVTVSLVLIPHCGLKAVSFSWCVTCACTCALAAWLFCIGANVQPEWLLHSLLVSLCGVTLARVRWIFIRPANASDSLRFSKLRKDTIAVATTSDS